MSGQQTIEREFGAFKPISDASPKFVLSIDRLDFSRDGISHIIIVDFLLGKKEHLPFDKKADVPRFKECAKHPHIDEKGYVLYYTSQCPFNAKYVPLLEQTAKENGIPFRAIHIESRDEAQNAPTPITNYALFHDGKYITNEQMNDKKFLKLHGS